MILKDFLYMADNFARIRIYHSENMEKPYNNYDTPCFLLETLPKGFLCRKVLSFGVEKAKPNKDNTIVIWVVIKRNKED